MPFTGAQVTKRVQMVIAEALGIAESKVNAETPLKDLISGPNDFALIATELTRGLGLSVAIRPEEIAQRNMEVQYLMNLALGELHEQGGQNLPPF